MEATPPQLNLNTNTIRRSQEYAFENIENTKEPHLSAVRDFFSSSSQLGHTLFKLQEDSVHTQHACSEFSELILMARF